MTNDEQMALEHVMWLARERRHTTKSDRWAKIAEAKGWITWEPGIMRKPEEMRMRLTNAGCAAASAARSR